MGHIITGDERRMTPLELALELAGAEYCLRDKKEEIKKAKENGLVIVFGASDDLIEFRGAIDDEAGVWNGGTVHIDANGIFKAPDCNCDVDTCPYLAAARDRCKKIKAVWGPEGKDVAWAYETDIPHSDFVIFDGEEPYCEGIVFSIDDLK